MSTPTAGTSGRDSRYIYTNPRDGVNRVPKNEIALGAAKRCELICPAGFLCVGGQGVQTPRPPTIRNFLERETSHDRALAGQLAGCNVGSGRESAVGEDRGNDPKTSGVLSCSVLGRSHQQPDDAFRGLGHPARRSARHAVLDVRHPGLGGGLPDRAAVRLLGAGIRHQCSIQDIREVCADRQNDRPILR